MIKPDDTPNAPQRFRAFAERRGPLLAGIICGALVLVTGSDIQAVATTHSWDLKEVFGAFFNLSAILCGALGTLYGLLVAGTTPFINQIRATQSFRRYLAYVRSAIGLSFTAALAAVPLLVTKPALGEATDFATIAVSAWVGIVVAMLVAFVRIAPPAQTLFEVRPVPRIKGG